MLGAQKKKNKYIHIFIYYVFMYNVQSLKQKHKTFIERVMDSSQNRLKNCYRV